MRSVRQAEWKSRPYTARRFFLKYQDRILFGTDTRPNLAAYQLYYRFLETDDEYFDTALSHHRQGFWMIYGVFLPKDVLESLEVFLVDDMSQVIEHALESTPSDLPTVFGTSSGRVAEAAHPA